MPSIKVEALSLRIIPGDHAPPHVHVEGRGWEMSVRLAAPDVPWERALWKEVNVGPGR